eukprot:1991534-Prymnesium_polylepis.1
MILGRRFGYLLKQATAVTRLEAYQGRKQVIQHRIGVTRLQRSEFRSTPVHGFTDRGRGARGGHQKNAT